MREDAPMNQTTTPEPAKKRVRALSVNKPMHEDEIAVLMREVFEEGRRANEASRKHDAARKALYAKMKESGMETFETTHLSLPLVAVIEAPTRQGVDPVKLQKLVSMEQFLSVVSVSQKAVEEGIGKSVLNQVLVPTTGTENVTVKVKR